MTIKSDALSLAKTYDVTGKIDASARRIHREIEHIVAEQPYQSGLDKISEVITITAGDRTSGTFSLDFTMADGTAFSVTGLAWNSTSSATQTAVDAAATAISGYVAGDIAVTGGPFGAAGASTVFTFSGESVIGDHAIVVNGTGLAGGTTDPAASETTKGVVRRFWFAALKAMGVIDGTDPAFGAAPAGQYTVNTRNQLENYPSNRTIRALIKEATVQEGQDWEAELLPLLGLDRLADGISY
jgi:hypothetical protein